MDAQSQNLLNRLYQKYLPNFQTKLAAEVASYIAQTKIEDQQESLGGEYAALDMLLGACGAGVPTDKPWVAMRNISLGNTQEIQFQPLLFQTDDNALDVTLTLGSWQMQGSWEFGQKCVQFLPEQVNKACATTEAVRAMAAVHESSIDADVDLAYLRQFRDELKRTPLGQKYVQRYEENQREVQSLLETNEEVKRVFTDNHALDLLNNVIQVVQDHPDAKLDKDKVMNTLANLARVLTRNGSPQLRSAIVYAKNEVPKYAGMSKAEIMDALTNTDSRSVAAVLSELDVEMEANGANDAEATLPIEENHTFQSRGVGSTFVGTRTKSGMFTDTIKDSKMTIRSQLDLTGNIPQFQLRASGTDTSISATLGDVKVGVVPTLNGDSTDLQKFGNFLATFLAERFGPERTSSAIVAQFQSTTFAQKLTEALNQTIGNLWKF